jgi:hypothetical protein
MRQFIRAIAAICAIALCITSSVGAQTEKSLSVPLAQRALSNLVSKYSQRYDAAPNEIQQNKVLSEYRQAFCAQLPRANVSGWIGDVYRINDYNPNKAIYLDLEVSIDNLDSSSSGALGIGLWLGNSDTSALFSVGSPLYKTASTLSNGDTVIFSGAFVPFSAPQACYSSLSRSTEFSFRFSSIRKIGSGLTLE